MIYNFSQYKQLDQTTLDFINGKIQESDFIAYLDSEVLNENILSSIKDFFGSFKQKVVDIFWSFLVKAYETGFAIFDKINTFVKWLFGKINSFAEKHPTLFKVIVITAVILIILIFSASSAKAQTIGQPIPLAKINMAIGWLDSVRGDHDALLVNKAIAHLIDIRDGQVDIHGLGDGAIKMAEAALNTVNKIVADSKTETDPTFFKYCVSLIERGAEYVSAAYSKSGGFENIRLAIK